jgi:hypothetical protein
LRFRWSSAACTTAGSGGSSRSGSCSKNAPPRPARAPPSPAAGRPPSSRRGTDSAADDASQGSRLSSVSPPGGPRVRLDGHPGHVLRREVLQRGDRAQKLVALRVGLPAVRVELREQRLAAAGALRRVGHMGDKLRASLGTGAAASRAGRIAGERRAQHGAGRGPRRKERRAPQEPRNALANR